MFKKIENFLNYKWVQEWVILVIILIPITLVYLKITPQVNENTLSIINLLVQSEAAVVAIVITLSLVAVQLVASAYSTRVIEIFRSSRSFWAVVILYLSSITFGITTLILAETKIDIFVIKNFILLNYYLGFISFISLVPFIWINFDLLTLSTVINKLALRITKVKLLNASKKFDSSKKLFEDDKVIENVEYNDCIQPVMDIIRESLVKYDYETVRYGLKKIDHQIGNIIKNGLRTVEINNIIKYLLKKFKRVLYLAISKKDEDSTIEILKVVLKNGIFNPNWEYDKEILKLTTNFIEDINNLAMDQRMSIVVRNLALSFGAISEIAAQNKDDKFVGDVLFSLEKIFYDSINEDMDVAAQEVMNSLLTLEKAVINNKLKGLILLQVLSMAYNFVDRVIEKENESLAILLFEKFFETASIVIEYNLDVESSYSIIFIEEVRQKAIERKLNLMGGMIPFYFGKILKLGIEHGNDIAIQRSIDEIINIAKTADKETFITKISLIPSLKDIIKLLEFLKPKAKDEDKKLIETTIEEIKVVLVKLEKEVPTPPKKSYFDL